MSVNLQKGQKVDLTKGNASINKIVVGLGWDAVKKRGGLFGGSAPDIDCDASAFLLDESDKLHDNKNIIYFGNLNHSSKSVKHMGDNLTGEGEGDDEQIMIDLSKVPANITKIDFTVTIYDAENRRQNFGQVSNAFIRIVNKDSGEELIRYDLGEDFSIETAVITAELYRNGAEWKFNAIGSGFSGGLTALCRNFGCNI